MRVGILHGAGVNPDGSLQPHTKARADKAIEAYKNSTIDFLLICGKNEASAISLYVVKNGVRSENILTEELSYSTLSNLYFSKMLLFLLNRLNKVDKVYLISNYWHIPRISRDGRKILGEVYTLGYISAPDPTYRYTNSLWESAKYVVDSFLTKLGYGRSFNEKYLLDILETVKSKNIPLSDIQKELLEERMISTIPSHQKRLMELEKMLYNVMRII